MVGRLKFRGWKDQRVSQMEMIEICFIEVEEIKEVEVLKLEF